MMSTSIWVPGRSFPAGITGSGCGLTSWFVVNVPNADPIAVGNGPTGSVR
jgi:hypothetical protein